MVTKCKNIERLDPGKGVNKFFENVLCMGRIQNFFQGGVEGDHILTFFPTELLQGKSRNKSSSRAVRKNVTPQLF